MTRRLGRPQALFLDWNGTAVDDLDRAITATSAVLRRYARSPIDSLAFRHCFTLPMTRFLFNLGIPRSDLPTAVKQWGGAMAALAPTPAAGLEELLTWCRRTDIPVRVLSAADEAFVQADIDKLRLSALVAGVHAGVDHKHHVLRRAKRTAGQVWFVGDTCDDVLAARAASAVAIAVRSGYHVEASLVHARPDCLLDDLAELHRELANTS